jgi:hypothetical protein
MGNDPDCMHWIARYREQPTGPATTGRRGGREGRRRAAEAHAEGTTGIGLEAGEAPAQ